MAERGMSPEAQAQIDAARRVLADHDAQACKDVARLIAKLEKTERALDCAKGAHFKAQLEHEERAAKLEQAERQLALFDPAAVAAYGDQRAREAAAKAESALAAAQGALRRVLEKVQSLIAEFGDRPSAALDIVNAYADETLHHAALAAESGKPEPRSVFPPHNHEPGAPIMARCSGCEAVKALLESGKIGTSRHEVECAARALWLIGNARIGDRPWDRVAHHYLFEAEAALLAARGLEYRIEPPPESSNAEPRAEPPALPAELSGKGEQPVTSKELDELGREGSGMALLRVLPRLLASARREQRARALLKRIEWSGNLGQNSYGCAECDFEERSGHAPGCELAALIAGEPGEAKKEEGGRHGR